MLILWHTRQAGGVCQSAEGVTLFHVSSKQAMYATGGVAAVSSVRVAPAVQ